MAHGGDGHFHDLIRGLAELVLHVDGRGGEENMDTRVARPVQGLPCAVDVVLVAAGERGDLHVGDGVGDGMDGFKVAHAGSGNPASMTSTPRLSKLARIRSFS